MTIDRILSKVGIKTYGPKWLGLSRFIPYPLRAMRIDISINPFGFWAPKWQNNKGMSERFKADGDVIWYARFAWFQIAYRRWL